MGLFVVARIVGPSIGEGHLSNHFLNKHFLVNGLVKKMVMLVPHIGSHPEDLYS